MPSKPITFRWTYIILPATIFLFSIIITAYFFHLLPVEVAYHFEDGLPDQWMSRGATIAWMLTPQVFFVLLAVVIVWGATKLSARARQADSAVIGKVLSIMGNMVALPQVILSFAMLDIFSYNAYQTHIMPLWVFALIAMAVGGIILGIFLVMAIRAVRQ